MTDDPAHLHLDTLRRCGDCGYELKGLPRSGKCPECGVGYSDDVIVLFGHEATPTWLLWMWGIMSLLTALAATQVALGGGWLLASISSIAAVQQAWYLWLNFDPLEGKRRIMQVQFSSAGYGWRRGYGPIRIRSWIRGLRFQVVDWGKTTVKISMTGNGGWPAFMIAVQTGRSVQEWSEFLNGIVARNAGNLPPSANAAGQSGDDSETDAT